MPGTTKNLNLNTGLGSDMWSWQTFINDNLEKIDEVGVCYVTTRGTSGNWSWRRWSDGRADCWCAVTYSNLSVANAWGSLFMCAEFGRQQFPFAFASIPHMTVTWGTTSGDIALAVPYNGLSTTSTGTFTLLRGKSGTTSGVLSIRISGTVA